MAAATPHIRQEVFFAGRVQGVGFRYTTQAIAADYAVTGYVRNLPDGRVQLVVEGAKDAIDGLLADIEERMSQFVRQVEKSLKSPATGEFDDFQIRF